MPAVPLALGLALSDPLGVTAEAFLSPHLAVQAVAGERLLCPDGEPCVFPGPLLAVDAAVHAPGVDPVARGVHADLHAGAGLGVGWVAPGCWYDAVASFCVSETSPELIARAPLGGAVRVGRLEVGAEAVPAIRVVPQAHLTFLGGFTVRWAIGGSSGSVS